MSVIEFKKLSSKLLKVSKIETLSGCGTKKNTANKRMVLIFGFSISKISLVDRDFLYYYRYKFR